jgi:hypothetical protein
MTPARRDAEKAKRSWLGTGMPWLALTALLTAPAASAGTFPGGQRVTLAVLAGTAQPVSSLADYQWDVRPRAAWGARVTAGLGRFDAGLRWWSSGTTQALGLPGTPAAEVHASSLELVARTRLAGVRGLSLHAMASGGWLGLGFDPDRVTLDAGGTPVEVELAPIHEWVGGAGLALEGSLAGGWGFGLEGERRVWALDTAHREGSGITYARDTFGDWSARLALRRTWEL